MSTITSSNVNIVCICTILTIPNNKNFHYLIESGETFVAPEVVMTCTDKGLSELSHIYHDFIRANLNKSRFMHEERPILINTWVLMYLTQHLMCHSIQKRSSP